MSGFSFTGFAPPAGESGAEGGAPAPFAGFAAPTIDGSKPAEGGLVFGAAAPAPAAGDDGADGAEEPSAGPGPEEESTAEFTPVVQLDEVEVRTHEEEESVEFKMRAKLYRFAETMLNVGSGKKEWIERGIGEIKLLKHKESENIRLLMRQEKTMKVIVNHVADPRISLQVRARRVRERSESHHSERRLPTAPLAFPSLSPSLPACLSASSAELRFRPLVGMVGVRLLRWRPAGGGVCDQVWNGRERPEV